LAEEVQESAAVSVLDGEELDGVGVTTKHIMPRWRSASLTRFSRIEQDFRLAS
jgi:hypothetical protein